MVSFILGSSAWVLEVLQLLYDGTLNTLFYKSSTKIKILFLIK
jgi:hypothetical protein